MKRAAWIVPIFIAWSACSPAPNPAPPAPAPERKVILTENAPKPIGPYSQAIQVGDTLYAAGQIAIDAKTGQMIEGDIQDQTEQVLKNLQAVLTAARFTLNDVVLCQVFLKDLNDYTAMNAVYARYFETNPPARAVVQAARIPRDALVEIMLTAVKTSSAKE